jgi:hypothetical protein
MNRASTILAAVAIAGLYVASSGAAETEKSGSPDMQLSANDLSGHVILTDAQRAAFANTCFARRTELFASMMSGSSIKQEDKVELKSNLDETFPRFCTCLEKGYENLLSKMQFLMVETMIGQGRFISYPGSPTPEFEALKKAAAELGMSSADFESARRSLLDEASRSAEACYLVLWGPILAQRMKMPEFRSYPGEPPKASEPRLKPSSQ